jgi:hypothetical protein
MYPDPQHAHHLAAKLAGLITLRPVTALQNPGIDPFLSPLLGSRQLATVETLSSRAEDRRKLMQAH